jgi:hypothetical protein
VGVPAFDDDVVAFDVGVAFQRRSGEVSDLVVGWWRARGT